MSRFEIVDAVVRNAEYAEFSIPSGRARSSLRKGDLAKMIFRSKPRDKQPFAERMWVLIEMVEKSRTKIRYRGRLTNQPVTSVLRQGSTIVFEPRHVIAIERGY